MINIKNILISNNIIKNSIDETVLFTEEFLGLFNSTLDNSDCIIKYLNNYTIKGKKITIPEIRGFKLKTDDATGKITNVEDDIKIVAITAEMKEINLSIALGSSALELQGEELKKYIANKLADLMIGAIHVRLANELIELGRSEVGSYTSKWIDTFMKANLKADAIVIASDDIPNKMLDINYAQGEYTIFDKKAIIVPSSMGFNGLLIVDKNAVDFYKCEDQEAYIDEISGNRKNVTYFGNVSYCNFLIKDADKCIYCNFNI